MANALYGKGRAAFGNAQIDWVDDTIKAMLVDTADYTVSIDTHEFLSDVPAGAREETITLTGKTNVLGVMDADDAVFTGTSGDPCEAIILYKDTGDPATSPLIAYIDTATGLPVTLGSDVTIRWAAASPKIFKL